MKNIHIIPTDKPSKLYLNGFQRLLLDAETESGDDPSFTNQHIYITSDEEFKEGDWFYVKTANIYGGNIIAKCLGFGKNCWSEHILTDTTDEKGYHPSHCVKIILTTDQDLIKDGVQAIDDDFLEWFVKNPSCEWVEVIPLRKSSGWYDEKEVWHWDFLAYKIIISKEENSIEAKQRAANYMRLKGALEPKQETLEEAAERLAKIHCDVRVNPNTTQFQIQQFIIKGAKWQQERMYSEEEVRKILWEYIKPQSTSEGILLDGFLEQFKKK